MTVHAFITSIRLYLGQLDPSMWRYELTHSQLRRSALLYGKKGGDLQPTIFLILDSLDEELAHDLPDQSRPNHVLGSEGTHVRRRLLLALLLSNDTTQFLFVPISHVV